MVKFNMDGLNPCALKNILKHNALNHLYFPISFILGIV